MILDDLFDDFGIAQTSPQADEKSIQLLSFDPNLIRNRQLPSDPLDPFGAIMVALAAAVVLGAALCVYHAKTMKSATSAEKGLNALYLAVFLESLASFTVVPALGAFIVSIGCNAFQASGIAFIYTFCQFIGSGIMGKLLDQMAMNRKVVIMWTLGACAFSHFGAALSIQLPRSFHLDTLTYDPYEINGRAGTGGSGINIAYWTMWLTRGIAGFFACTVSLVQAMVAEISPEEVRTANIATVMGAFAFGMMLGPVIGGSLYQFGMLTLCYTAFAITAVNTIYGYFVLDTSAFEWEESDEETRSDAEWSQDSACKENEDKFCAHPSNLALLLANFFSSGAEAMYIQGAGLINLQTYHWGGKATAISFTFCGLLMVIAQIKLTGLIVSRLGEVNAIVFGSILRMCTMTMYSFIFSPILPWYGILLNVIEMACIDAPLQGLIPLYSPEHATSTVFGIVQSARCLAEAIFPLLAGILSDIELLWPLQLSSGMVLVGLLPMFFLCKDRT